MSFDVIICFCFCHIHTLEHFLSDGVVEWDGLVLGVWFFPQRDGTDVLLGWKITLVKERRDNSVDIARVSNFYHIIMGHPDTCTTYLITRLRNDAAILFAWP